MPIYEYQCSTCGHQLEALQKMGDEPLIHCPECHEKALKKIISPAGFQLKGTGWYETDFKNSGKQKAAKPSTGQSGSARTEKPAASTAEGGKKSNTIKGGSSQAA